MSWLSGNLSVTWIGNVLKELDSFAFQNQPDDVNIERGELGDPVQAWRASAYYQHGNWQIGWTGRYVGNMKLYDRTDDTCEDLDPCATGSSMYHDLNMRYVFGLSAFEFEVYGGVRNVANEEPPHNRLPSEGDSIFNIGRTWYLGLRSQL